MLILSPIRGLISVENQNSASTVDSKQNLNRIGIPSLRILRYSSCELGWSSIRLLDILHQLIIVYELS